MKVLIIAANVLRRLFRDRTFLVMGLVVPVLLVPVLGAGSPGPSFGIVLEDDGALAAELAAALHEVDDLDTRDVTRARLMDQLRRGEVFAGVVIPAGYSADLAEGSPAQVEYLALPDSVGFESVGLVEAEVAGQAARLQAAHLVVAELGANFDAGLATAETIAASTSVIGVRTIGVDGAKLQEGISPYTHIAAIFLLLFVFIAALATSFYIVDMRRLRLGERMLSTPTSATSVLAGATLGRFLVSFVQTLLIVVATALIFSVDWGNIPATLTVLGLFALTGAGAGILLGTAFRNPQPAMNLGIFIGIAFAVIGGSLGGPSMPPLDSLTPHLWAKEALDQVLSQAATIADILPELGMLALLAFVYLALAVWRFRRTTLP